MNKFFKTTIANISIIIMLAGTITTIIFLLTGNYFQHSLLILQVGICLFVIANK